MFEKTKECIKKKRVIAEYDDVIDSAETKNRRKRFTRKRQAVVDDYRENC